MEEQATKERTAYRHTETVKGRKSLVKTFNQQVTK